MKESLQQALNNVDMTYAEIVDVANDMILEYTRDISDIMKYTEDNIESLTNDDIRKIMLKLSVRAYSFGDVKEKSAIKAECAEMLRKEAYAKKFSEAEGPVAAKDSAVTLQISNEIVAEAIYNLISSLFKVKLDEIRRMIDTLKTILMSRVSEMKLSAGLSAGME